MGDFEITTYPFKSAAGIELTLDVYAAPNFIPLKSSVALIHYHGGFLVLGEKTTFPPTWLIRACVKRGWLFVSPQYRLLPEATGAEVISDALDAAKWVLSNVCKRLVVAGSSAGGYLAFTTASQLKIHKPLAVLSIYGMLDISGRRYITPGTTLMGRPPLRNLNELISEVEKARAERAAIAGYPFPLDPSTDPRMAWIAALHEKALYPDLLTEIPGLSSDIRKRGLSVVPEDFHGHFPVAFELSCDFPPCALVHGEADIAVEAAQSTVVAERLEGLGVKVLMETFAGKGHGFDVREIPADCDIETSAAEGDMYEKLSNILRFLDHCCM